MFNDQKQMLLLLNRILCRCPQFILEERRAAHSRCFFRSVHVTCRLHGANLLKILRITKVENSDANRKYRVNENSFRSASFKIPRSILAHQSCGALKAHRLTPFRAVPGSPAASAAPASATSPAAPAGCRAAPGRRWPRCPRTRPRPGSTTGTTGRNGT